MTLSKSLSRQKFNGCFPKRPWTAWPMSLAQPAQPRVLVRQPAGQPCSRWPARCQANRPRSSEKNCEIAFKQAFIDKLAHEMAVLKRLKFAAQSEAFNAELEPAGRTIDTNLAALAAEFEQAQPSPQCQDNKQKSKRQPLSEILPRREIHHEPENTTCACGCHLKRPQRAPASAYQCCWQEHGVSPRA
jgi:hypothetical protein